LGHGLAKTTCDRASFRDGPELGTCEGGAGREGGAVGSFGLGGTVGSRLLLGAELTEWSGFTNPTPVESFARDTLLTSLMATARVYPVASAGGFLKGGVGLASHLSRTGERRRRHGLALAAGAGYDVRIGRNVSLTPLVEFLHGSVGDTTTPPGAITLADVRQSVWAGSLRLTLH
jgi:hypothetical protein